jgi:hypothetical protein
LIVCHLGGSVEKINECYRAKKESVARAITEKNWGTYVSLHERPYRLNALLDAVEAGLAGAEYWKLVGRVWTDSENIWQHAKIWRHIWSTTDSGRAAAMDDEEQKTLAALPNTVTIYRGTEYPRNRRPLSWTLDQEKALWFANRFAKSGYLLTGEIQKKDILAVILGRKESEVVALKVKVLEVRQLPLPP